MSCLYLKRVKGLDIERARLKEKKENPEFDIDPSGLFEKVNLSIYNHIFKIKAKSEIYVYIYIHTHRL